MTAEVQSPPVPTRELAPGVSMLRMVLVLGSLIALGPLTIDLYLPALPSIAADLRADEAAVQLTLTGSLVGLALGQLLIGPISDAVGRRKPMIAGVTLHVVASVLCMLAPTVEVLGVLRVLQGVGTAAASVVAMAVVRDVADGNAAARLISRLMLVMGAAPVLAPTLGGQVLRFTDWRGVFGTLAALGAVLIVVALVFLRETLPPERRQNSGIRGTVRAYRALFADRVFVGLVLVAGLSFGALFAYVSGASFVYQEQFGLSQQAFGLAFGAGSVSLIVATQVNAALLRRFEPNQILPAAVIGGTLAGLILFAFAATGTGGLLAVMIPMMGVLFGAGLAFPNAPALALSRHGESAGAAAAMLGAFQFGLGALIAPLIGLMGVDSVAMATGVVASLGAALLVLLVVVRPWSIEVPVDVEVVAVHRQRT